MAGKKKMVSKKTTSKKNGSVKKPNKTMSKKK